MTYLVTGASSGIGRAVAVRLAEHGHKVVAGVRREGDAPAHPSIRPVLLDVTDAAQMAAAANDVAPLSGLINNAGVAFAGPLEYIPLGRLREQLEINVVGVVAACQAFLPALRAGHGRIVIVSSTAGRVATPLLGAYNASKFAAEAIADTLRQELSPWRLPVVVVEPGSFKSRNRATTATAAETDRALTGDDAERRYGPAMDAFLRFSEQRESKAGHPDQVAAVIEEALTTDKPRPRYLVGSDARMVVALSRCLPTRILDAMLAKSIGLPQGCRERLL